MEEVTIHAVFIHTDCHVIRLSYAGGDPFDYFLRASDEHGLAPSLNAFLVDWLAAGNTPVTYVPVEPPGPLPE